MSIGGKSVRQFEYIINLRAFCVAFFAAHYPVVPVLVKQKVFCSLDPPPWSSKGGKQEGVS